MAQAASLAREPLNWDIPFGHGRRFANRPSKWLDPVISGWSLNWIFRYVSGNPINKPDALFLCASYFATVRGPQSWFNNEVFTITQGR